MNELIQWPIDLIAITGETILIDPEDSDLVVHRWRIDRDGYVVTSVNREIVHLSWMIAERMGLSDKLLVDHWNRNKLDNQRQNLRQATKSQNNINQGLRKDNSTGYKGVNFNKRSRKYVSRLQYQGNRICLGYFENAIDAAKAYNFAVIKYFGEFGLLNEVPE